MYPNPAVAVRKNSRFSIVFHIFPNRTLQKVFTAYSSPMYQIEANEMPFQMLKKLLVLINRYV